MSTHENGPSPSPTSEKFEYEGKDKVPFAFLTPDAIELLRKRQHDQVREAQGKVKNHLDLDGLNKAEADVLRAGFDSMIDQYLKDFKVADDDPQRDAYINTLKSNSINAINDQEWNVGVYEEDGTQTPDGIAVMKLVSGREKARDNYSKVAGVPKSADTNAGEPAPDENEPDDPKKLTEKEIQDLIDKDPSIVAGIENVNYLRDKLAEITAHRQRRLWTLKKKKQEYATRDEEYRDALKDLIKRQLDLEKQNGLDRNEDDQRLEVAFRLMEDFRALQEATRDKLRGTKAQKMMDWMTNGGMVKRLARGVLVGAAVGGAGLALTFFTGGMGLALVGATGLGMGGRFARSYATFANKEGKDKKGRSKGMGALLVDVNDRTANDTLDQSGGNKLEGDELIEAVQGNLMNKFEKDTKREQFKRGKSVAFSIGAMAIGSAASEGLHYLLAGGSGSTEVANAMQNNGGGNMPQPSGSTPELPHVGGNAGDGFVDTVPKPEHSYSFDAQHVIKGEGFNSEFKQMGYPKEQWADLLKQVGPKLHDVQVNGHPLAYKMPSGEWGLRMTPDGTMPKEALDIISNTHDQMFGTPHASLSDAVDTGRSHPPVVHSGAENSGGASTGTESLTTSPDANLAAKDIVKMHVIQPSEVHNLAQLEQLTHVSNGQSIDVLNQTFRLPNDQWNEIKSYISAQTSKIIPRNDLYYNNFKTIPGGAVQFATNKIPDNTMADILNRIRVKL